MNKLYSFFTILFVLTVFGVSKGQEVKQEVFDLGLKVVSVTTVDGEEPTADPIKAPQGSWGLGLTNVTKVPGSVKIFSPEGDLLYDSGDYLKKESGMTIKIRGNTSAQYDKKPFKIKLEKKADLLLRDDKNLRDKNWLLLADRDLLRMCGFILGKVAGLEWAPAYEWVNVVVNGDYRGNYMLVESVERNETCRIQTEETGFVTERDPYWWNENGEYLNSVWLPQFGWTMKYPDFEDFTDEQKDYVQSVLDEFEAIISTENYADLIDVDSFCRWLICQDVLGTSDGGGTNLFIAKKDNTPDSKLYVPVLWDTDSAEEIETDWSRVHKEPVISLLFNNNNKAFVHRYIHLYNEISADLYQSLQDLADQCLTEEYDAFARSAEMNNFRWTRDNYDRALLPQENAEHLNWWLNLRKPWLDLAVDELTVATAVEDIVYESVASLDLVVNNGVLVVRNAVEKINVFSVDGRLVYSGTETEIPLPAKGVYIITSGNRSKKIVY